MYKCAHKLTCTKYNNMRPHISHSHMHYHYHYSHMHRHYHYYRDTHLLSEFREAEQQCNATPSPWPSQRRAHVPVRHSSYSLTNNHASEWCNIIDLIEKLNFSSTHQTNYFNEVSMNVQFLS